MTTEGTIFDLVDLETEQIQVPQRTTRQQAAREVGLGVTQGAGDIAQLVGMAEGSIQYPLNKLLGTDSYKGALIAPGQQSRIEAAYNDPKLSEWEKLALLSEDDEIMPMMRMPGGRKALDEALEQIPEEGLLQEGVRRATRSLPGLAGGPIIAGEMAARDLLGLGAKEAVKKMGFGEGAQTAADFLASLTPFPKKAIIAGNKVINAAETGTFTTQKELVDYARRAGMAEAEIAPLVKDGWFSNLLTKVSPRRGATEKALHQTKAAIGKTFEGLRESPAAQKELSATARSNFLQNIEKKLYDLPANARNAITEDVKQLMEGPMTGDRLMKFWGDINANFKQHPKLGALKGTIKDALSHGSAELASDFNLTNTLFQRGRDISSKLKPTIASDMFGGGEALGALWAATTFNYPALAGIAGTAGGRKLAQMMLTDPRYHNLSKKMVTTLNAGQVKASKKILDQMIGMIQKESPETAATIQTISMEDLENMLEGSSES